MQHVRVPIRRFRLHQSAAAVLELHRDRARPPMSRALQGRHLQPCVQQRGMLVRRIRLRCSRDRMQRLLRRVLPGTLCERALRRGMRYAQLFVGRRGLRR